MSIGQAVCPELLEGCLKGVRGWCTVVYPQHCQYTELNFRIISCRFGRFRKERVAVCSRIQAGSKASKVARTEGVLFTGNTSERRISKLSPGYITCLLWLEGVDISRLQGLVD